MTGAVLGAGLLDGSELGIGAGTAKGTPAGRLTGAGTGAMLLGTRELGIGTATGAVAG